MLRIPGSVRRFARVFSENDHELYIVGGAVRDALLGTPLTDYDFATSATPREVQKLFRRVIPTGIQHGTVSVLFEGNQFEVTTYRVEGDYTDRRHPDSVSFTRSLEEDLARRDFTINAIALDPETTRITDPHDGRKDLEDRVIRTVGSPQERFSEDALRMIRAIRFSTTLAFRLLPEVLEAIRSNAPLMDNVSLERVAAELDKMMAAGHPSRGWGLLRETELLVRFLPELEEDRTTATAIPVFEHLIRTCDCTPRDSIILRWSGLLHDVGKPRCQGQDAAGIHFHGHDEESARMSDAILSRLRFSNDRIKAVSHLVRHHMFGYDSSWSDAAVRRFVARVGPDQVFLLTALRRADACGKHGRVPVLPDIDELEERVRSITRDAPPLSREDLAINGNDLINALGIRPGPSLGIILEELLQTVLDDPAMNDRDTLLTIAGNFHRDRLSP